MSERKSLKDISWDVSEEIYRADPALSYSKLSSFFKQGPKALISSEKIDTPSLRFGSLVDTILTAPEEFDDRFYIADIEKFSSTIRKMVEEIHATGGDWDELIHVPEDVWKEVLDNNQYQTNWKYETRIKKVVEQGEDYFTVLKYSEKKTVVTPDEFQAAQQCVITLKAHPFTYHVFECNEDEEIFYQLKFKANIEDCDEAEARIMTDIIKVNHKEKWIQPYDLKTTGKDEEKFEESFDTFCYWIQAGLYSEVIDCAAFNDELYGGYDILPFKFIVINKDNLTPIIWDTGDYRFIKRDIFHKHKVTWKSLLSDANWHLQNGKFDYSRRTYEGNGINLIQVKN